MNKKWVVIGITVFMLAAVNVAYAAEGVSIWIHGKKVSSNEPVKIENGTTLVPLRVIAESLNQNVQWDPITKTVSIDEKKKSLKTERMVVQREKDIFVAENPENAEIGQDANRAFIYNLTTLYNKAYRGLLSSNLDADTEVKTADQLSFIKESEATREGSALSSSTYVRLVRPSYVPETGENAPASKDILFYIDSKKPEDLHIAVQNPKKLQEWRVYKVSDYGKWLQKEIDIYVYGSRGL
ncbi:copper amine oxidase N-terminal domain-containing protein [Paenibacillus donghaensis]|uniref:copper amine oxidase N-terminal domain-containing protein n=1 Tax=Paenibacillus donghaensis TaxID=414771 RepID=UPI001884221E|nr:copper amine oxidase N-terminal domain-containing protein [Paenibacillus donghaensis]MBE9914230.1 copper amine oxidase N-terminal domain-containing protein [Paenibacillus donghaensis]